MTATNTKTKGFRFPILQGVLPINGSQVPAEIMAGITLAALAMPTVMGYTKIAGMPVITFAWDSWRTSCPARCW